MDYCILAMANGLTADNGCKEVVGSIESAGRHISKERGKIDHARTLPISRLKLSHNYPNSAGGRGRNQSNRSVLSSRGERGTMRFPTTQN
jgi:hypothetical protein